MGSAAVLAPSRLLSVVTLSFLWKPNSECAVPWRRSICGSPLPWNRIPVPSTASTAGKDWPCYLSGASLWSRFPHVHPAMAPSCPLALGKKSLGLSSDVTHLPSTQIPAHASLSQGFSPPRSLFSLVFLFFPRNGFSPWCHHPEGGPGRRPRPQSLVGMSPDCIPWTAFRMPLLLGGRSHPCLT